MLDCKAMFINRHQETSSTQKQLESLQFTTADALIDVTVPPQIRLQEPLILSPAKTEAEMLDALAQKADKNQIFKTYIGQGYYNTHTPSVILRNLFENPGWYTAYTPYQAEISQGRLEMLFNYQTVICELTGLPVANASLLDEATAAAEAMTLLFRNRPKTKKEATTFFVDAAVFEQTKAVLESRAIPMGITLVIGDVNTASISDDCFGVLVQYPDQFGQVRDYKVLVSQLHERDILVAAATDLLALTLLTPPGEWGADVAIGCSQRFGVPLGYGGPHAGFIATKDAFKRQLPGRIIGLSKDRLGQPAYRMALQTREQHIRREKATSSICTAQSLLAVMAAAYAIYHGPDGLKAIATEVHHKTARLVAALKTAGVDCGSSPFFDTITFSVPDTQAIKQKAEANDINVRVISSQQIGVSLDETTTETDLASLAAIFGATISDVVVSPLAPRSDKFLAQAVFNSYHTETEMMRYLKRLENKDLSLTHAMIPLGSCTMKLNAATEMIPVTWRSFSKLHPFAPVEQAAGYHEIITELEGDLARITGFDAVSLQPNSGAQGELAGLLVIRAYHEALGDDNRDVMLIPSSAHGTNPATAAMAGMKIVVVPCDDEGNITIEALREKAIEYSDNLAGLMITYPSTHGVFEPGIKKICQLIHDHGGQVYMDGANLNAQVGLTSPGEIGADVCHLNLHKTFAIPHGGGGPGVGPIGVAKHLAPYLPGHPVIKTGGDQAVPAVNAAPWGSASILLISYAYIKMMGAEGLTAASKKAILNANYLKAKLEDAYPVLYTGENGYVAHELIIDCRAFKKTAGVDVEDIAKRLIDYGFHAPTMSWPVAGTLMIEPTESESIDELDRFCEAMIAIRAEIAAIESGDVDKVNNVLKQAPHPLSELTGDSWPHGYSRSEASQTTIFYSSVARVDNAFGDRNLVCACPPVESYEYA